MMMKNDRGMTLVEVLAALTILGIVFVGLMTVFPQMTLFNAKTESKLETMNAARQELARIDSKDKIVEDEKYILSTSESTPEYERYRKEEKTGTIEIDYYLTAHINKEDFKNYTSDNKIVSLNKIHIKLIRDDKVVSETFGYVKE